MIGNQEINRKPAVPKRGTVEFEVGNGLLQFYFVTVKNRLLPKRKRNIWVEMGI